MLEKSTLLEIEERFDKDVERFSNLETGQQATIDALYNMEIIARGISASYPSAIAVLDIGCGAGNYDLKLLEYLDPLDITLSDLSQAMLDRAWNRITAVNKGKTQTIKGDFRLLDFDEGSFDVIIATAVLHHLRDDRDWESSFQKLYRMLKPGGSIWIFDLIQQESMAIQDLMYNHLYGQYLSSLKDDQYQADVFAYIEKEDSPRSLLFQVDLLRKVGFKSVDIMHKNLCFASFVAFK